MATSDYNYYKTVDVASYTGSPSETGFPGAIFVDNGTGSTTGTGTFKLDTTGFSTSDFAVYTDAGTPVLVDFYVVDLGGGSYLIWFRDDHTFDGSTQFRLYYDRASGTDESVSEATVWDSVTNLISRWSLNEEASGTGNAGTYRDSTSNNNDGTDNVSATGQGGQFGDGQALDGVDDSIDVPDDNSLTPSSSTMTVMAWVAWDGTSSGTNGRVLNKEQSGGGTGEYELTIDENFVDGDNSITFRAGDSKTTVDGSTPLNTDGTWNHVAGTYDGSTQAVYLDGSQENSASNSFTINNQTGALGIGGRVTAGSEYIGGNIDEVQLYDGDVGSDWIQAHYDMSPKAGHVLYSQGAEQDTAVTNNVNAAITSATATPINTATVDKTVSAQIEAANVTPLTAVDNAIAEETAAVTQATATPLNTATVDKTVSAQIEAATATPLTAGFKLPVTIGANVTSATFTPLTATDTAIANKDAAITAAVATPLTVEGIDIVVTGTITSATATSLTAVSKAFGPAPAISGETQFIISSNFKWFDMGGNNSFKVGDTADKLTGTLKDEDGAVDVSSANTVKLYLVDRDGNTVVDGGSMDYVTDGTDGQVEYDWQSADVDEALILKGEIVADYSDGEQTYPNDGYFTVTIEDDLQ